MIEDTLFAQFHFLRPYWLGLLLPFSALTVWLWRRQDPWQEWQNAFAPHLLPFMVVRGSDSKGLSPPRILAVLLPLIVIALAGPSWTRGESPFAEDSAALVIAIDLSASMASTDLLPSRLQRARDKALQLARLRGDAYTALVAYAGSAHTVLPLSNDSAVLVHYLSALKTGMLPRQGKTPQMAISPALALFGAHATGGTLLLMGDGAGNDAAAHFATIAERPEIQLIVWGIGKDRDAIAADRERGLQADAPPLQEAQLKAIAERGDGYYQSLSADDRDVRSIYRRVNRHYRASDDTSRPWVDSGYYLLAPIAILFLLWFRSGWVLRW